MAEVNPNSRLEAFCDGVFAIAITLLILDIRLPSTASIDTTHDFWLALKDILPSVLAFLLSFIIILITWVNHHNALKLVNKSSASFIYANGFLLLAVVFIPFPTALLGEYLFTDHASPAVIIYVSTIALQSIGWILLSRVALRNHLYKDEHSAMTIRQNGGYGYFAFTIYFICAIIAFWYPLAVAIFTTLIWIYWLFLGIYMKPE